MKKTTTKRALVKIEQTDPRVGRRIKSLGRIAQLSKMRKSAYHAVWKRPVAAAWLISMQAREVHILLERPLLYEYFPERKKKKSA